MCTNFILVLSQESIDSCTEEDDWLYKEIYEAIETQKNIVCVFIGDVKFPNNLPESIAGLRYQNGIKFDIVYFDSFIAKLISQFLVPNTEVFEEKLSDSDFLVEKDKIIKYLGRAKNVVIPDGIKIIGEFAFKDKTAIEKISFPDSVRIIEESAFERCLNVSYLILPQSLKIIKKKAFNRCFNVSYVQFNSELEHVEQEAFGYCNKLKNVILNSKLISIDSSEFNNCSQLASICISDTNEYYTETEGVLYNKDMSVLIRCPEGYRADIVIIPDSVTTIESWAFYKCTKLIDVILPRNIEFVRANAFKDCCNIKSISVFDSIKEFDISALDGWTQNQQVYFSNRCNQVIRYNITKKLKENQVFETTEIYHNNSY